MGSTNTVQALKKLAVAITGAKSPEEIPGTNEVQVIDYIAENYPKTARPMKEK
ncbi:MAG: hypothetical protein ACK5JF_03810 [Oscillospiraceae bacterium]